MHASAVLILLAAHVNADAGARYSAKYSAAVFPPTPQSLPAPEPSASERSVDDLVADALRSLDEREGEVGWPRRVVRCARQLGVSRCVKAFALCRGERAAGAVARGVSLDFHLRNDLEEERFPWERYTNASEEQLDTWLLEHAARVFEGQALTLAYPGLLLDVHSQRNGSLHVNFKKDSTTDVSTGRGRGKRWRRTFYRIVPFLLIPSLIMAAILPFKLPAFMMMSMGAVLLNNMAFTGSLFNLLRNNAFDDNYEKKVIYINEGYKNEDTLPTNHDGTFVESGHFPDGEFSETTFSKGPFSDATFPKDDFTLGGYQSEIVQEDNFFPTNFKGKKRRGNKHKRRPGKRKPGHANEGLSTGWEEQGDSFPAEELVDSVGAPGQYAHVYREVGGRVQEGAGGGAGGDHLAGVHADGELVRDYGGYKKSFKSKVIA